jgi:hypothetical protein
MPLKIGVLVFISDVQEVVQYDLKDFYWQRLKIRFKGRSLIHRLISSSRPRRTNDDVSILNIPEFWHQKTLRFIIISLSKLEFYVLDVNLDRTDIRQSSV